MKKKRMTTRSRAIAYTLILVMALTLIPSFGASASGAVTLSVPKTQFADGERVWVTVTGITPEMIANRSWVGVYDAGGATSAYHKWVYVKTVGTEIIPLDLPRELGTYEIRFVPQSAAAPGHSAVSQTFTTVANPPVTDDLGAWSWEGEWNTNWGKMTIRQNGSSVEGEYENYHGRFDGTVYGNTVVGKWYEEQTYLPPRDSGLLRLWMSEGGNSFVLGFCYGYDYPSSGWSARESVARITGLNPAPSGGSTPAAPATPPPASPTPTPATGQPQPGGSVEFTAAPVESGVKFEWSAYSGALGYRVFRSKTQGDAGISITDFAVAGTSFVDVNVDPATTYYYTFYAVIKEATAQGDREQLSDALGTATVTTGATILGGGVTENGGKQKSIILMKLNDTDMLVNGVRSEIDPGRGTAPILINSRTMIPIRAVIEAMGGTVGWDEDTKKITLEANGHKVEMWLGKREMIVDGQNKEMDVTPQVVNGRTMVPVRFAAENVGCAVDWIGSTSEIIVVYFSDGSSVPGSGSSGSSGGSSPGDGDAQGSEDTASSPDTGTGSSSTGPEIKTSYTAAEIARLKSEIEMLIQDQPTGGRVITYEELAKLIDPYVKEYGSGNTYYVKMMNGQFEKRTGRYYAVHLCSIIDSWYNGTDHKSKSETLHIVNEYQPEKEGSVECMLNLEDANFYYMYQWFKTATTGIMYKIPKSYGNSGNDGDTNYDPGKIAGLQVTLYPDATVDGQQCIVYSYQIEGVTSYHWFSKTKGFEILYEVFNPGAPVMATYYYDIRQMDKNSAFYDPSQQGVTTWTDMSA